MSLSTQTSSRPAEAADEVVTHAISRDVALPCGAGLLVLITLDNHLDHTKPTTLGPQGLQSLDFALEAALARPDVVAVGLTGKPYFFCVGADLKQTGQLRTAAQARAVAERGHQVFNRLRTAAVPTFAFVNGAAMGGGTELALSCHYRTISASVPAVALPEVFLGLIPGWGGATLLPQLLGIEAAVRVIVAHPLATNRMLSGPEAYELGLADALFEPADFLEQSLRWAADVVRGTTVVSRAELDRDESRWEAAVAYGRGLADAAVHGAAPAAYRALDLLSRARKATVAEGFAAEEDALTDLIMGEEFRASVYAFDLAQRRAKRPVGAPDPSLARPVTKVGIVGAGLMAGQLALLHARRLLVPVVMTDLDQARVDRGLAYVHSEIASLERKGRMSPDLANRLRRLVTGSVDRAVFADADFVIEAVFEDLEVKRQVFAHLELVVRPDCVLATNTSSLSVSQMAANLAHPERVVGFHFFNPVAAMPLLEIVRAERTDDASLATAFAVGRTLKKSCVLVADAPGFVVNRLLVRFLGAVASAVDDGASIEDADRALAPLGLPMSPFELLGLVGPPIALHAARTLTAKFPERFTVPTVLEAIVTAGKSVVWLTNEDGRRYVDPEVAAMVRAQPDSPDEAEILRRTVDALAAEARLMLDEGVVAAPQDLDMCMLLGAGWPFHLGGLTPYLDRSGVAEEVTGARFLPRGVASVPDLADPGGSALSDAVGSGLAAAGRPRAATIPPAERVPTVAQSPAEHHDAAATIPPAEGAPTVAHSPAELPEEAFAVASGELTPRGMTLQLALGGVVRVAFAMPLPVASIGMLAGRPLPVPTSMFTAVLSAMGTEVPIDVASVKVLSAGDGTADFELVGTARFAGTGLPYADRTVTLRPTVSVMH